MYLTILIFAFLWLQIVRSWLKCIAPFAPEVIRWIDTTRSLEYRRFSKIESTFSTEPSSSLRPKSYQLYLIQHKSRTDQIIVLFRWFKFKNSLDFHKNKTGTDPLFADTYNIIEFTSRNTWAIPAGVRLLWCSDKDFQHRIGSFLCAAVILPDASIFDNFLSYSPHQQALIMNCLFLCANYFIECINALATRESTEKVSTTLTVPFYF